MNESLVRKLNSENSFRKKWRAVVIGLCAVVAFGTSYALINPATTSETQTYCGLEEHEHTDECFEMVRVLDCPYEEGEIIRDSGEFPAGHSEASPSDAVRADTATGSDAVRVETATYSEASPADDATPSDAAVSAEAEAGGSGTVTITRYDPEVLAAIRGETIHHHTEECYKTVPACSLPEHKHTLQCFSNPEADIEDASVWERDFEDAVLTGNWNKDVLTIAETQIGYAESTENYEVGEDGTTMHGYTRYGEWYGIPYGDWCAMFAAFCQHYAGVDSALMPAESDCDRWIEKLSERGLYAESGTYVPAPGDLVFFDWDEYDGEHPENRTSEHVGIVEKLIFDSETKELTDFTVIEGNSGDCVCVNSYEKDCRDIMGYGRLPQNPEWFAKKTVTETGIEVTVEGINGSLPYPSEEITLIAEEIKNEESQALLAAQLSEAGIDYMDMILMDITLLHGEDEIEPEGPVYLSFAAPSIDTDSTVYHIDEKNETVTEMSTEVNETDSTASVETEHFSTFALTVPAKGGKNVTAEVRGTWNETDKKLENVKIYAKSTAKNLYFNYDYYNGADWTIGAGSWSGQTAANTEAEVDIMGRLTEAPLSAKFRARAAQDKGTPENNNSGYSEEFSVYDIFDSVKAGFTEWVSGPYMEFFGGTRPTTFAELNAAFAKYFELPSLTLNKEFTGGELIVNAVISGQGPSAPSYVWEYYDDAEGWTVLSGETGTTLNASKYSSLNTERQESDPLLDGGKTVRCRLYEGTDANTRVLKAVASIDNVNPLQEVYDQAVEKINEGLHLSAYSWYLTGKNTGAKTANVSIGSDNFNKYFYYDGVARNDRVPFSDAETYRNYLASEYIQAEKEAKASGKSDEESAEAALSHAAEIWDKYIFDLYNPNPEAGVVGNYSYYPKANTGVDPGRISTYGDKIIEWPKDSASSFHNQISEYKDITQKSDIILPLNYNALEGGVDYKNFIKGVEKTAVADEPGDKNTARSYDIDIKADTQAASLAPIAMLITVQTSWQMFDYPHANAVKGDGTYTSIEVGGAQHNTEMADLYDIKQAILRFIDYMDENYPGHNLVLGINEVQHGGSYNLINQSVGGDTVYVSNDSEILRKSLYNWDIFGNCEHVHYDVKAMSAAAGALETNLAEWQDENQKKIDFSNINKVAVIIGGGTENTDGTNGYGCTLPWGTFLSSKINSVYALRANAGEPLNPDGVLSWLDYYTNNTGAPYVYDDDNNLQGGTNFSAKYVTPNQDAVFNALVRIVQQEIGTKGIKMEDPSSYIEKVTLKDTVNDEFMIEKYKPFTASVMNSDGSKAYETVITPTAYDENGKITSATAEFITYNSDGTKKSSDTVTCTVDNVTEAPATVINLPVTTPGYDGDPSHEEGETYRTFIPMHEYTQKLVIRENADRTTNVSFDFGNVYNTLSADLHLEVIARDDYIGSNNVLTNKGTPEVSYHHTASSAAYENVDKTVEGTDTPEVNVPVRFDANDAGTVTVEVKTPVHLEDLKTSTATPSDYTPNTEGGQTENDKDSEFITGAVHDLIDNYDQITGTVSYTWVLPGGKEYSVPVKLHVTGGKPDQDITKASEMAMEWIPKSAGTFDAALKVTFTPDPVEDHGNFADDGGKTATRVTAHTEEGHEKIIVTGGTIVAEGTKLTVNKVWAGEKGTDEHRPEGGITFNVFQNGEFLINKTLTEEDDWTWTLKDLPYKDGDKVIEYTVTEDKVPNYQTSYGEMKAIPHPGYWAEVKFDGSGNIPLTDEYGDPIEYLIVDKSTKKAVNAEPDNKVVDVTVKVGPAENEFINPPAGLPADTQSYFSVPDGQNYNGWYIKYTDGTTAANNYVKSAVSPECYIKNDLSYVDSPDETTDKKGNPNNTTLLAADPGIDGKIRIKDQYLKIDNNGNLGKDGNVNNATAFIFYKKSGNYWYELPASETLDLTGSTPYMIFDKSTGKAVNPVSDNKVISITGLKVKAGSDVVDPESFPKEVDYDDYPSFIEDDGYRGWYFAKDGSAPNDNSKNYIEAAAEDTELYIKKDGAYVSAVSGDTKLVSLNSGKIGLGDKFLKINNVAIEGGGEKDASAFSFYVRIASQENPTYQTTVTNTYIPTGDPTNETKVAVKKVWSPAVPSNTEITVRLLQNGKEVNSMTLDGTETPVPWEYTFTTLRDGTTKLPYFDPLTDEPYEYTVTEDIVSGYETGYKKYSISDPGGGLHYLPYKKTGGSTSSFFTDDHYTGWIIHYDGTGSSSSNYIKAAGIGLYIGKEGNYAASTSEDTKLISFTDGKIHLKDKYLKIDNGNLGKDGDQNKATPFSFFEKHGEYWEEVPLSSLDCTGGTEYMIVAKASGKALKPDSTEKLIDITVHTSSLFEGTGYVLTAGLKNDDDTVSPYMFSYDGTGIAEKAEISNDPWTYGTLSGTGELTNGVSENYIWTVENVIDPKGHDAFYLKVNGRYLGVDYDKNKILFSDKPVSAGKVSYYCQLETATDMLYFLTGNGFDQRKYLKVESKFIEKKIKVQDGKKMVEKKVKVFDGLNFTPADNSGTVLNIFEQVSLSSKYDTYGYDIQNISTGVPSPDGRVEHRKYIDYLDDNIEETGTKNPDTDLCGDYYRLYLDATGTRREPTEENQDPLYPSFTGVSVTDHLSRYVTIADRGYEIGLTINKVELSETGELTGNVTYLWYGNLNTRTGSIGEPIGDGASVIKSVQYRKASGDESNTSTGMIRVDFQPDYKLEEGYKYIISYNVELTDFAKSGILYPDDKTGIGDDDTDYPGNATSSGQKGFRSNREANVVYTQDDVLKIGIYQHPVVQVAPSGYELPSTGGKGTLPYILGGLALVLAAAYLTLRRLHSGTL